MLTGIILAISRTDGETAPLIMTMLGTTLFFTSLTGPVDALPLRIWRPTPQPYAPTLCSCIWVGAALVLILLVLSISVILRLLAQRRGFRIRTTIADG
ncbi:MAG: hypothetical protein FIO03_01305 [Nitrosopumilales archaeon]|nr:hypothetical protein [Nitrosopumilales archaeon]